jgi:23S rRNA pseudouridine2605 synthase
MRLQKFLSHSGVSSRRKCELIIKSGKIKVNDKIVNDVTVNIDLENDFVVYNNKLLKLENFVYIALNKPIGFITTVKDEFNRPTILDLIKIKKKIFPVGRLDCDTSGLIILTNDGDFANKIIHPKNKIIKKYIVCVKKPVIKEQLNKIKNGIIIDNKKTFPCEIRIINKNILYTKLEMDIVEGRNRQIRKIFEKFNNRVINLKRVAINKLELKKLNLKNGEYKFLSKIEINSLVE